MKLYCAWSSFLQNWDRRIINKKKYYYSYELIRCITALFAGCMLIMYTASGAVNTLCFVWKFSCIKLHSFVHAYMCINDICT